MPDGLHTSAPRCREREPSTSSVMRTKDGVIGRPSLWIAEEFWVLRFRLMVKRGPLLRPQASEGEAQHGPFCWIVENLPDLAVLVEPLLLVRRVLREQFSILHRRRVAAERVAVARATNAHVDR